MSEAALGWADRAFLAGGNGQTGEPSRSFGLQRPVYYPKQCSTARIGGCIWSGPSGMDNRIGSGRGRREADCFVDAVCYVQDEYAIVCMAIGILDFPTLSRAPPRGT